MNKQTLLVLLVLILVVATMLLWAVQVSHVIHSMIENESLKIQNYEQTIP